MTNDITEAYSITINAVCTHTDGRRPRIDSQSSTAMMAAAMSQVTTFGKVELGDTTNSRYAPARVMFPMLKSVPPSACSSPVPIPATGEVASPTHT